MTSHNQVSNDYTVVMLTSEHQTLYDELLWQYTYKKSKVCSCANLGCVLTTTEIKLKLITYLYNIRR